MINKIILENTITQKGVSINEISKSKTVLLVFLRHFGCVFCREAMKELSKKRAGFEKRGVELIFVHMSDDETAQKYFNTYNLAGVNSISNPTCSLYDQFGLTKGKPNQLFGLKNWVRGFEVVAKDPSILSLRQIGDGFQMPGIFMILDGEIKESFIHKSASDRPDYDTLVQCCVT